jgi:hypothetical protein
MNINLGFTKNYEMNNLPDPAKTKPISQTRLTSDASKISWTSRPQTGKIPFFIIIAFT